MKTLMRIQLSYITLFALAALLSSCGTLSLNEVKNFDQVDGFNLGGDVNSASDDYCADLHGDRLLFTSNRPTVEGYIYGEDFWFTDRQGKTWTQALNLGASINSRLSEGSPHIVANGDEIYFVQRDSEDGLGDEDIYHAELDYNGKWQKVRNLGEGINTKYWDSHPYLSPDGEELYFSSDRPGGFGGTDIYVAKRTRSGRWGRARNLGSAVNTSGNEASPMMAPDNETLFFASTGHPGLGGFDIFMTKKAKRRNRWSAVLNVGRPMNSRADDMYFRLSAREDTIFMASNRHGGYGELDIWGFAPNPYKDTTRYTYYIAGMVFDTTTKYGIRNSTLKVEPKIGESFTMKLDRGKFRFRGQLNATYTLTGMAKDYTTETITITVPGTLYYNEFRKNIGLASTAIPTDSVKTGTSPKDQIIVYFDFDKSTITGSTDKAISTIYKQELKQLTDTGQQYDLVLNAYTCDLGTEQYNVALSRRRGAAVSKMFMKLGVPVDAIVVNAYGEVAPGTNVDENERSSNRRVEIVVIPMAAPAE
jgi:outer membrane protein OmpA-like peptidoglycan-associated protein